MSAVVAELSRLVVAYDGVTALDGIDFVLREGERVALRGPNGSGKTTLLVALSRTMASRCVLVPQAIPACALRGADYAMLGRTPRLSPWRRPSATDFKAVHRALAAVGMEDFARRRLDAVSGGERQLLGIALALASESPVLLLDEPMAHLDEARRERAFAALAASGRTMVAAMHIDAPPGFFTRTVNIGNRL